VISFTFNREIYASWSRGGLVWLASVEEAGPPGDDDDQKGGQQKDIK